MYRETEYSIISYYLIIIRIMQIITRPKSVQILSFPKYVQIFAFDSTSSTIFANGSIVKYADESISRNNSRIASYNL